MGALARCVCGVNEIKKKNEEGGGAACLVPVRLYRCTAVQQQPSPVVHTLPPRPLYASPKTGREPFPSEGAGFVPDFQ